jgi:hypothetical protein
MASGLPSSGSGMTRRYPLPILALSLVMAGLVPAIPIAWSAELLFIGITALDTLSLVMAGPVPAIPIRTGAPPHVIGIPGRVCQRQCSYFVLDSLSNLGYIVA